MSDGTMIDATKSGTAGTCPECGVPLAPKAPEGLCPRCLLGGALQLARPKSEPPMDDDSLGSLLEGRVIANYEIIKIIARGGMGAVFRARQKKPERVVALKVIAAGELATRRMVERFRTEGEAAARLDHPNIVPIYEVGHEAGWHFFSMRLIEGGTLGEKLGQNGLPSREAALLLAKIARAVHHAHERGVLHRDLKPANILLDSRGEPHLTDFGLARMIERSVELTLSNVALGTPAYMAPEQAAGGTRDITVSVDIYGLGAVFYEMLTGRPPFEASSTHALLRMVAEDEPIPPSHVQRARKSTLVKAAKASSEKQRGGNQLSGSSAVTSTLLVDLDAICLKCLEKEPVLRYRNAEELADDLERAVRGEAISARASTATQRARKWVRRNPAKAGLVATVAGALMLLTFLSLIFNLNLTRARNTALRNAEETRKQLLSVQLHENARLNLSGDAPLGLLPLIQAAHTHTNDPTARQRVSQRLSATLRFSPQLRRLWDAGGTPMQLQFSQDGQRLLAVLRSGEPRVWDLRTCKLIEHPDVSGKHYRASFVNPDGSQVMEFFKEAPYGHLWNLTKGTLTSLGLKSDSISVAAFSLDGKTIGTGGDHIHLWDTLTGEEKPVVITNNTPCFLLLFSPDGEQLITSHRNEEAWRWNLRTGGRLNDIPMRIRDFLPPRFSTDGEDLMIYSTGTVQVLNWPSSAVKCSVALPPLSDMNLSPDGRQFVIAAWEQQARVWDVATSQPVGLPITHETGANKAVFSPDGALLATAGWDYQVRIVLTDGHRPLFPAIRHSSMIEALAFSPDSRFLALGDADGVVQVWDLQSVARSLFPHGNAISWLDSPDGRLMVTERAGALHVYDLTSSVEIGHPWNVAPDSLDLALSPTGRYISEAFATNAALIWDFSARQIISKINPTEDPTTRNVVRLVFKPDDSEFLTMTANGLLQRWSMADGKKVGPVMAHGEKSSLLLWSNDGRWILAAGKSSVTVWDARTSLPLGDPIRCRSRENIAEARFSPDGKRFLVAFGNTSIEPAVAQMYELPFFRLVGSPLRHGDGIASVVFSSDGKWVATGGEDNVARVWRVADAKPITGELRHNGIVFSVLFSPDGRLLATACTDGRIRLWDVERGELLAPAIQCHPLHGLLWFTPDGRKLLTLSAGTVWSVSLASDEMPLEKLETLVECQTGLHEDSQQTVNPLGAAELARKFSTLALNDSPLVTAEDTRRWHSERATAAERQGSWFTAVFHLEHLLARSPEDAALQERLDRARRELSVERHRSTR